MSRRGRGSEELQRCPKCNINSMARRPREGFWKERIAPLLGLYPWECWKCRQEFFLRDRGQPVRRRRRQEEEFTLQM